MTINEQKLFSENHHHDSSLKTHSWWKRVGWLILIWSASVVSLGIVALLLRKLMTAAGMST